MCDLGTLCKNKLTKNTLSKMPIRKNTLWKSKSESFWSWLSENIWHPMVHERSVTVQAHQHRESDEKSEFQKKIVSHSFWLPESCCLLESSPEWWTVGKVVTCPHRQQWVGHISWVKLAHKHTDRQRHKHGHRRTQTQTTNADEDTERNINIDRHCGDFFFLLSIDTIR